MAFTVTITSVLWKNSYPRIFWWKNICWCIFDLLHLSLNFISILLNGTFDQAVFVLLSFQKLKNTDHCTETMRIYTTLILEVNYRSFGHFSDVRTFLNRFKHAFTFLFSFCSCSQCQKFFVFLFCPCSRTRTSSRTCSRTTCVFFHPWLQRINHDD